MKVLRKVLELNNLSMVQIAVALFSHDVCQGDAKNNQGERTDSTTQSTEMLHHEILSVQGHLKIH